MIGTKDTYSSNSLSIFLAIPKFLNKQIYIYILKLNVSSNLIFLEDLPSFSLWISGTLAYGFWGWSAERVHAVPQKGRGSGEGLGYSHLT